MVELKISVSEDVAKKIKEEIEAGAEFSIQPTFDQIIKLDRVDKDGVVTGQETAEFKSVEFVDYMID